MGRIFIYEGAGLDSFDRFWSVFWVVAVGLGRIFMYVGAGLDGFGRFWSVFWVVADNLGRIFRYVGAGLDGFERFSALLDAILIASVGLGLQSERIAIDIQ